MSKDVGELATIPIRYEGQRKERLVLLEFQGALSVSRMDTETGEVANSENLESFDGVVIGQLVNFGSLSKNLCDPGVEFPREAPVELKVGYHTLKGKVSLSMNYSLFLQLIIALTSW